MTWFLPCQLFGDDGGLVASLGSSLLALTQNSMPSLNGLLQAAEEQQKAVAEAGAGRQEDRGLLLTKGGYGAF